MNEILANGVLANGVLAVVLAAAVATFVWRALGAVLVGRIDPEGAVVRWFTLTSYALLAALVVRLLILPSGSLAELPLAVRVGAMVVTLAVWRLAGRRLLPAVLSGTGCIVTAGLWLAPG